MMTRTFVKFPSLEHQREPRLGVNQMRLPVYLIGEDSLALASLRQQLEKEAAFFVEPKVHGYGEALDHLRTKTGAVLVVVDLNRDPERAFAFAEEVKFRLSNVHLVMTSPDHNPA